MTPDQMTEEIIRSKTLLEQILEDVKELQVKVDCITREIQKAQNQCATSCVGMFVSSKVFSEAIGPLKKYVYGTLFTVIGAVVVALLTRK